MSNYKYGRSGNKTSEKFEKSQTTIKVIIGTLLALVPLVVYIVISTLPPSPTSGKSIDKGRFDPSITFTTDWFTFTAPKKWEEVASLHIKDKMYVYRETNGGEYIGLLKIYINTEPFSYQNYFTRVLPVEVVDKKAIKPTSLEPHCNAALLPGQNLGTPTFVTQADVTFFCWTDGTNLYAVAGEIGGTSTIKLTRANGETANYVAVYTNTAFTPSESSFAEAMQSFEAR